MSAPARRGPGARRLLHPLVPALALLALGVLGALFAGRHDLPAAVADLLLLATAGAAAGFANSGST
jgi:hypothetical protein